MSIGNSWPESDDMNENNRFQVDLCDDKMNINALSLEKGGWML